MAEPEDDRERDRTATTAAPDRLDTNEKADDLVTVTQPGGDEEVPRSETEKGRSVSPASERGARPDEH